MLLTVFVIFFLVFLVFSLLLFLTHFLGTVSFPSSTKLTPYECGFSGVGSVQTSYSLHFFSLMLVFVVFDLEVVLLLSFVSCHSNGVVVFLFFWSFIYGTYYLERYFGTLNWIS